jgi:hypothetical protein
MEPCDLDDGGVVGNIEINKELLGSRELSQFIDYTHP